MHKLTFNGNEYSLPNPLYNILERYGFEDVTFQNDMCPSFELPKKGTTKDDDGAYPEGMAWRLWIEATDPSDREEPTNTRYCLTDVAHNCFETESTKEVISLIKEHCIEEKDMGIFSIKQSERSLYIEDVHHEYPDLEVITLKDGSTIGINGECICLYKGDHNSTPVDCITRPEITSALYMCVWGEGYDVKEPATHDIDFFTCEGNGFSGTRTRAIKALTIGQSINITELTHHMSVVRIS